MYSPKIFTRMCSEHTVKQDVGGSHHYQIYSITLSDSQNSRKCSDPFPELVAGRDREADHPTRPVRTRVRASAAVRRRESKVVNVQESFINHICLVKSPWRLLTQPVG